MRETSNEPAQVRLPPGKEGAEHVVHVEMALFPRGRWSTGAVEWRPQENESVAIGKRDDLEEDPATPARQKPNAQDTSTYPSTKSRATLPEPADAGSRIQMWGGGRGYPLRGGGRGCGGGEQWSTVVGFRWSGCGSRERWSVVTGLLWSGLRGRGTVVSGGGVPVVGGPRAGVGPRGGGVPLQAPGGRTAGSVAVAGMRVRGLSSGGRWSERGGAGLLVGPALRMRVRLAGSEWRGCGAGVLLRTGSRGRCCGVVVGVRSRWRACGVGRRGTRGWAAAGVIPRAGVDDPRGGGPGAGLSHRLRPPKILARQRCPGLLKEETWEKEINEKSEMKRMVD
ncbi:hypothetical protein CBR_g30008 [Chara braunii]|uniref:Uncharacterized protein n=1 Tax=Chara braunii TaxID=69332 RepID=A0A388LBS8_CHABU|nr:hypothetical protein CBR_g30008 [Chara braunii]|eukprot:GBG79744.1 hypothetical protein CBR_g30008 [Chara braunii]